MDSLAGRTVGPYQILEQIGAGGMATVYKAYQPSLERYVAIKVLPTQFAREPGFAQRFRREARAVAHLEHPHILPVYDYGQEGDLSYLVMRYIEAGTLKEQLGRPLELTRAAELIGQMAQALDHAHQQGVIHRDVKPSNVLLDRGKWALLSDFGVARMLEGVETITADRVGVGTPAYMSPEQGQGKKVDRRSDVYSLGVVLYEMLTGRVPFEAETPLAVVLKHINDPLPLPKVANPNVPEGVERVVLRALAKSPEDRFPAAGEMARALRAAVEETEILGSEAREAGGERKEKLIRTEPPRPRPDVAGPAWIKSVRGQWLIAVALFLVIVGAFVLPRLFSLTSAGVPTSLLGLGPEPTQVARAATTSSLATEEPMQLEYSFDNARFDTMIDRSIWGAVDLSENCDVGQFDGALRVRGTARSGSYFCGLTFDDGSEEVKLDRLSTFRASIKVSGYDGTGFIQSVIRWFKCCGSPRGDSETACGISVYEDDGGRIDFSVEGFGRHASAELDRWYEVQLTIDQETKVVSCIVDGVLFGSATPKNPSDWEQSTFRRDFITFFSGTGGVVLLDNLYVAD